MNGWMGNLLRVNLTTKTSSIESSEKYFKYIGGKGKGDLRFRVTVEVPRSLDKKQKELLQSFSESCGIKNYTKRESFFKKRADRK